MSSGSCFASESGLDGGASKTLPKNVEILSQTRVAFKPDAPVQQLLSPLDLFPLVFRQYHPWAVFYDYDIDFQRLVDALHTVAQKYVVLSGRVCENEEGKYAIEVGSVEGKDYDFPVVEMKAEMRMAEAVLLYGRITMNSAEFPVKPAQIPFYLEPVNMKAVMTGQNPVLYVKLIHFSDGCCLGITMSHLVSDGMRFSELHRDISRAYCGKEVPMRDLNRQQMMIEGFSKHFNPEDKEDIVIPEKTVTGREPITFRQYPNETSSVEILHLSKAMIDEMKSKVAPFIPEGSFVSTADLMNALLWMLSCELNADCGDITTGTDLDIAGTSAMYVAELCCNGHGVVPNNYLGSALLCPILLAGDDVKSKSLIEVLASLATLSRQKQVELQERPKQVFKCLVAWDIPLPSVVGVLSTLISNFCKFAISDTDFGGGTPSLYLSHSTLPGSGFIWFVSPVLHNRGVFLGLTVSSKQKERLKKSSVLKECAPGVKSLFDDFEVSQLDNLMKTKQC